MARIGDVPKGRELALTVRQYAGEATVSHCVFTAEFMLSFAEQAGITREQAVQAGLLHDLHKDDSDEALLTAAARYGIVPNAVQRAHPALLHGPVASADCRLNFGLADEEVLEAIYWHTTGRPELGAVGLALYFADYAEPLRRFPDAVKAREMLRQEGFRRALRFAVDSKLTWIRTRAHVDPVTEQFHAWIHGLPEA